MKRLSARAGLRLSILHFGMLAGLALVGLTARAQVIDTFAGSGVAGFSGDGGPALAAELNFARQGLIVGPAGGLFISDTTNSRVRRVDLSTGIITTIAGNGLTTFSGDGGQATDAGFGGPLGLALDGNRLLIATPDNRRVRAVDMATGIISTIAGTGFPPALPLPEGVPATASSLDFPEDVAVDSAGNILIVDSGLGIVRRTDATTGLINTIAGQPFFPIRAGDGGPAADATFEFPVSVAVDDADNIFIVEQSALGSGLPTVVRRIDATTGIIDAVAGGTSAVSSGPALEVELGTVFHIARDATTDTFLLGSSARVWRFDPVAGTVTAIAGDGTPGFSGDGGDPLLARFNEAFATAVDAVGNVFIADRGNQRIRRIVAPPVDVVVTASTSQSELDAITVVTGSLIADAQAGLTGLAMPNLQAVQGDVVITNNPDLVDVDAPVLANVGGDITVSDNPSVTVIDLGSVTDVGVDLTVSDNPSVTVIDLGSLADTGGSLTISDNTSVTTVDLVSLAGVTGDLTLGSAGDPGTPGALDLSQISVGGGSTVIGQGVNAVDAKTPAGETQVTLLNASADMTVLLPQDVFGNTVGVPFRVQNVSSAEQGETSTGTGPDGGTVQVQPVAAYRFSFDIPTLNANAELLFKIDMGALTPPEQEAIRDALLAGTITLAVRGDAPGAAYQAFAVCGAGETPTSDGCVSVLALDADGLPVVDVASELPASVVFEGVTGSFSTWAVAFVIPRGDLNRDGAVDMEDFNLFLSTFGRCEGQPGYNAAANLDDSDSCITFVDYQIWYSYLVNP